MKLVYANGQATGLEYLSRAVADAVTSIAVEERGGRVFVVIPDQMAVTVEDALSRVTHPSAQFDYDVVSFRRLADYIFRSKGGVYYRFADKAAETVTMWRTLSSVSPHLLHYKSAVTPDTVPTLLSAVEELKSSMVSPEELMRASIKLADEGAPSSRIEKYIDIANIYETYNELLSETYDDRLEALTHAVERVHGTDFFTASSVFVYAFSGFTAQQSAMIAEMTRAHELTLIFPIPGDGHNIGVRHDFDGIAETRSRLHATAARMRVPFEIEYVNGTSDGDSDNYIPLLTETLWSGRSQLTDDVPDSVSVIEAASRRAEAEAAAIKISEAVRAGLRYRDIAVCTGSVENYSGIVDAVFDAYSIPYHMSYRAPVEKMPLASALLAALRTVIYGWRTDDIITYIKTGLTGLSPDEEDELILYMRTWSIGGRRFRDPDGGAWAMNPDGYTVTWTERGHTVLAGVNKSRTVVAELLEELADAFIDSTDAKAKTSAVRTFLERIASNDAGSNAERLPDIITDALYAVEATPGAIKNTDYFTCLRLVLDTLSVGSIPSRTDEVQISNTIGMRGRGCRLVIMMGCADGELPAFGAGGFFTESERVSLEGVGVSVGESAEYKSAMELYNLTRCISFGENVIFTYRTPENDTLPTVISRVCAIFPNVRREKFDGVTSADLIYSIAGAAGGFTRIKDSCERAAATAELSGIPAVHRVLDGMNTPISASYETVSDEVADSLFGGNISFSQSRLESFVSCKFGFYCSYVLGLRERARARIDYANIGTFIHAVLEKIFSSGMITRADITDAELEHAADNIIADYMSLLFPNGSATARMRGLWRRLRRSVLVFLRTFRDEFAQSKFRPVLFEAPFGMGEGSMPPLKIKLDGGGYAQLRGIADRIDTYRDADGNLFVRVVDYKTGNKTFDREDMKEGHNLQLPLYLYTVCTDGGKYIDKLGGRSGDILVPAGFLYVGVRPSDTDAVGGVDVGIDESDAYERSRRLPRRGILLADESVLRAMDSELSGDYIPVRMKKDGKLTSESLKMLADSDGFDSIYRELEDTVRRICAEARSGDASAVQNSACKYCRSKAVCRRI